MTEPASVLGAVVGGRYELVRKLGRGGMGEVYEARRRDLGDRIAVKLLREEEHDDPETRARFLREARTLAQVSSPHVVRIVDFEARAGEVAFLVMEYLEGQNASQIVRARGPFSPREVLPLVKQLCAGVAAIHAVGLVHRDIKPQNIMIVDGGPLGPIVKLVDFGLAKSTHVTERPLTDHLSVLGTPSFMAPEQVGGNATIDSRADVYGTAATFVAMATGKTLYEDGGVAVVAAILAGKRLSVHHVAPELGPMLCASLERALSGDRTLRHATIAELAVDIERGLLALQSSAHATIAGNVPFVMLTVDDPPPIAPMPAEARAPQATVPPRSQRSGTAPLAIPPLSHAPQTQAPVVTGPAHLLSGPPASGSGQVPFTPANVFRPSAQPPTTVPPPIGTYPSPRQAPIAGAPHSFSGAYAHPLAPSGKAPSGSGRIFVSVAVGFVAVLGLGAVVLVLFVARGPLASAPPPAPAPSPTSTAVLTSAETPGDAPKAAPPPPVRCVEGPGKCALFCAKLGASWKSCAAGCANTAEDPANCGACGHECAKDPRCRSARTCTCRGGRCEPRP